MGIEYPEFVDNPESRCPVVLILDVSASMEGAPIEALNTGLAAFKYDIEQDELASLRVEVGIITFGETIKVVQDFTTIDNFTPPQFETAGKTPLGGAIDAGLDLLDQRKIVYRESGVQYYRPWVFLITDGAPTDGAKWVEAAARVRRLEADNCLSFFTIAVEGADMDVLRQVAPLSRPPLELSDLKFEELFRWLSASVRRVSTGTVGGGMLALPSVSGWALNKTEDA